LGFHPKPHFFFEKKKQKTFNFCKYKVFVHFFQKVAGECALAHMRGAEPHGLNLLKTGDYMRSSFFEFHVAVSGLMSAQSGLQTVAHNTANAATRGFSRQVAQVRATTPLQLFNGRGMVGTGSQVFGVIQIRDVFLDKKFWGAQPTLGEFNAKRTQLSINQAVLSELNGTGLSSVFNRFFDTLQDLIGVAGENINRTNLIMSAESMSTFFKDTYETFLKQQRDINGEIAAIVQTINSIGGQIHTLNEKIRIFEVNGDNANDLRDQRALLVDDLSRLVNIEAYERDFGNGDKRFFVKINGQDFVMNNNIRLLEVRERTAQHNAELFDANGNPMYSVGGNVYTQHTSSAVTVPDGQMILTRTHPNGAPEFILVNTVTDRVIGTLTNLPNDLTVNTNLAGSSVTPARSTKPIDVYRNGEDNSGMYDIY